MRKIAFLAVALIAATPANAQDDPAAASATAPQDKVDKLSGWYEVRLSVPSTRCLTQQVGGEYRAVLEATAARRGGIVLHLERLNAFFQEPIVVRVTDTDRLVYSGSPEVRFGPISAPVPTRIIGRVERDGESFEGDVNSGNSLCRVEGELRGKRTAAPPPPPTGPGASVFTDGYVAPEEPDQQFGVSVNSDGSVPLPPPAAAPEPPSPLIKGSYSTVLQVTESRCYQDFRGSWQRLLTLQPLPGISIPLQEFSGLFSGPVVLFVEGLRLSRSVDLPIAAGTLSIPMPAKFEGVFTTDASRFNVRFEAGNSLCRISGTIEGTRV